MINKENRLTLSVSEAASLLGISRNLAYELANRGELPGAIRLGQKRLIVSRCALEKLLSADIEINSYSMDKHFPLPK